MQTWQLLTLGGGGGLTLHDIFVVLCVTTMLHIWPWNMDSFTWKWQHIFQAVANLFKNYYMKSMPLY